MTDPDFCGRAVTTDLISALRLVDTRITLSTSTTMWNLLQTSFTLPIPLKRRKTKKKPRGHQRRLGYSARHEVHSRVRDVIRVCVCVWRCWIRTCGSRVEDWDEIIKRADFTGISRSRRVNTERIPRVFFSLVLKQLSAECGPRQLIDFSQPPFLKQKKTVKSNQSKTWRMGFFFYFVFLLTLAPIPNDQTGAEPSQYRRRKKKERNTKKSSRKSSSSVVFLSFKRKCHQIKTDGTRGWGDEWKKNRKVTAPLVAWKRDG